VKRGFWTLIALLACGPAVPSASARTLFVRCGTLIVDASKPPLEHANVVIVDGRITEVGTDVKAPAGAQALDLSAYTVMPGIIDAHSHLYTGAIAGTPPSVPLQVLRAAPGLTYALRSGIVAIRTLGSAGFIDVALRDAIDEGTLEGPHIVPAAHALTIPGGHGDFNPMPPEMAMADYYTPLNGFVDSPADAEKAVHLQIKYGARVIKLLASGGVASPLDSPTAEQLSPEEMRVAVEQAHMDHIKVAAHAENTKTIMDALHAGVDSIEHGSGLDQAGIEFMLAHGVFLVPTLHVVDSILHVKPEYHYPSYMVEKGDALAKVHFASFKLALAAGVKMAAGNDGFYRPGGETVLDELITDVQYGMSPQQALVAATKGGAELLGLPELGSIEAGKEGDLVAVQGDPLTNIEAVKETQAVVFKGEIVLNRANH
jgi:imidazolonepropionase-like amidohydrolase